MKFYVNLFTLIVIGFLLTANLYQIKKHDEAMLKMFLQKDCEIQRLEERLAIYNIPREKLDIGFNRDTMEWCVWDSEKNHWRRWELKAYGPPPPPIVTISKGMVYPYDPS